MHRVVAVPLLGFPATLHAQNHRRAVSPIAAPPFKVLADDHYGIFSAVGGDTVSIKIYVPNSGNANIQASIPRIFDSY